MVYRPILVLFISHSRLLNIAEQLSILYIIDISYRDKILYSHFQQSIHRQVNWDPELGCN